MRGRFSGNDVGGVDDVSVLTRSVVLFLGASLGLGVLSVRLFSTNLVNKLSIRSWTESWVSGEEGDAEGGEERVVIGTGFLVTRARL